MNEVNYFDLIFQGKDETGEFGTNLVSFQTYSIPFVEGDKITLNVSNYDLSKWKSKSYAGVYKVKEIIRDFRFIYQPNGISKSINIFVKVELIKKLKPD